MPQKFQNFINGKWVDAKSGRTFENRNPANWEEIVGVFPKSGKEDVDEAVNAATKAFPKWSALPIKERAQVFSDTKPFWKNIPRNLRNLSIRKTGKL